MEYREIAGLDVAFSRHDLHRTLATVQFVQGGLAFDGQAQFGHPDASTPMRFALAGDALERRNCFRTRWARSRLPPSAHSRHRVLDSV